MSPRPTWSTSAILLAAMSTSALREVAVGRLATSAPSSVRRCVAAIESWPPSVGSNGSAVRVRSASAAKYDDPVTV